MLKCISESSGGLGVLSSDSLLVVYQSKREKSGGLPTILKAVTSWLARKPKPDRKNEYLDMIWKLDERLTIQAAIKEDPNH